MINLLHLKATCEEILAHLDKRFKGCNINYVAFEDNMVCIYTGKPNKIPPITKHIATHINFFRDHIYDKNTNPVGDIILEKWLPRFTQKI